MEEKIDGETRNELYGNVGIGGGSKKARSKCSAPSSKKDKKSSSAPNTRRLIPADDDWPKDLPEDYVKYEKDWKNFAREVIHQGEADICWVIALSRCLEYALHITGRVGSGVHLSAQHLLNNVKKDDKKGMITHFNNTREFLIKEGLVLESECEFTGKITEPRCYHDVADEFRFRIKDLIVREKVDEAELIELVGKYPRVVLMDLCKELHDYSGGIYTGPKDPKNVKGRHAVVVTGYGSTSEGVHYWDIQNTWGSWWGEGGFARVIRKCGRKANERSLFVSLVYPELVTPLT